MFNYLSIGITLLKKEKLKHYTKIDAVSCAFKPLCKQCESMEYGDKRKRERYAHKDGAREHAVYDLVPKNDQDFKLVPALVNLKVQHWKCPCGKKFQDPGCPYFTKAKTSEDFDEYITYLMCKKDRVTNITIGKWFDLDPTLISKAVKKCLLRNDQINKLIPIPNISRLYIATMKYTGKTRMLIFGRVVLESKQEVFTLIDMFPSYDRGRVSDYIKKGYTKEVIGPNSLQGHVADAKFTAIEQIPAAERPRGIYEIAKIAREFERRKISFDGMKMRLIYHSDYRMEQIERMKRRNARTGVSNSAVRTFFNSYVKFRYFKEMDPPICPDRGNKKTPPLNFAKIRNSLINELNSPDYIIDLEALLTDFTFERKRGQYGLSELKERVRVFLQEYDEQEYFDSRETLDCDDGSYLLAVYEYLGRFGPEYITEALHQAFSSDWGKNLETDEWLTNELTAFIEDIEITAMHEGPFGVDEHTGQMYITYCSCN